MPTSYLKENLYLIRKEVLGISAEKFAKFLEIPSRDIYNNYEMGRTDPSEATIRTIAQRIGINRNDLINKKLKKTDVPVIVVKEQQPQASPEIIKTLELLQKQLEQAQAVNEYLMKQLQKDAK
jgi:transcriptional regulator with XRE-family HTH domain